VVRSALTLGRVAGIEIGVHYSWLFIAGLVAWSLAGGHFPSRYPGWDQTTYWAAGGAAALVFFGSVLLHELAHSLVAQARGLPVASITLFLFGGVSALKREPESAGDEFLIAAAGPAASFLLAGAIWAGTLLLPDGTPVHAVLGYLAFANLLLGAFNLLPGFPLDGGRVLRAILWGATRSLRRATEVASYVGQGIGLLLVLAGIAQLLGGAVLNGLWTAVIGHFLSGAAANARQEQALQDSLRGLRAGDVMQADPAVADAAMTLEEFLYGHVLRRGRRALPVVGEDGRLAGIVSVTDAKEVPQPAWPTTPVGEVMTRAPLTTVTRDTGLDRALRLLAEHSLNQLPVVDGGRVVGLLTRADVLRVLRLRQALGVPDLRPRAERPVGSAARVSVPAGG
jgi:Zn-dependent protease/CBS domain-containing protein